MNMLPPRFLWLLPVLVNLTLRAATVTWTGGGDGKTLTQPENWGGTLPTAADAAVIPGGPAVELASGEFAAVQLTLSRSLTVSGGLLNAPGGLNFANSGTLVFALRGGEVRGPVRMGHQNGVELSPDATSPLALELFGDSYLSGTISPAHTVTALTDQSPAFNLIVPLHQSLTNRGTLTLDTAFVTSRGTGYLTVSEDARFVNVGSITVTHLRDGNVFYLRSSGAALENQGEIHVVAAAAIIAQADFRQLGGSIVTEGSGYFRQTAGRFELRGGRTAGDVGVEGATLATYGTATEPSALTARGSSGLTAAEAPNTVVTLLGYNGVHGYLDVPAGLSVTNRVTIRLASSQAGYGAFVRISATSELVNEADIEVLASTPGPRTLQGQLRNFGRLRIGEGQGGNLSGTFDNYGRLTLTAGSALTGDGTFRQLGGSIVTEGSGYFRQTAGRFELRGGRTAGDVGVEGATLATYGTATEPSALTARGSSGLTAAEAPNTVVTLLGYSGVHGYLDVPAGLSVTNRGTIRLTSSQAGHAAYVRIHETSELVNEADIEILAGTPGPRALQGQLRNFGRLRLDTSLTLGVAGARHRNYGRVELNLADLEVAGGSFYNEPTGVIAGNGRVNAGGVLFENRGLIQPGFAARGLTFAGNYVQTASGRLELEVTGLVPGVEFQQFKVEGSATLAGLLVLRPDPSFVPPLGTTFPVITWQSRTGEFDEIQTTTLPPGRRYTASYLPGGLNLVTEQDADDGPLRLTLQPTDVRTAPGLSAQFSAGVAGPGPYAYQWRRNGVSLPGATNAVLTFGRVAVGDAGTYQLEVRNDSEAVTSRPVRLSLGLPLLFLADNLAERITVSDFTALGTWTNTVATRESVEPRHAGKEGGHSVWLGWRAPQSGLVTVRTTGSSFDTLLAVYSGTGFGDLVEVASDEDRGGFLTSEVKFNAVAGTEYLIAVDGFAGASGDVVLSWELVPTVEQLPEVTAQPVGRVLVIGETVPLTAVVKPANASLQWFANGQPIAGATSATLTLPAVTPEQAGSYRLRATAPNGLVAESRDVLVEVSATAGPVAFSADKLEDLFLDDAVAARGGIAPASRPRREGSTSLAAGWIAFNTRGAFTSPKEPLLCGGIGGASRWFRFRAQTAGDVTLGTTNTTFDTMVAVFTNRFNLTPVACNDDVIFGLKNSSVKFRAEPGVDYLVVVDGKGGDAGACTLTWKSGAAVPLLGEVLFLGFSGGHFRFEQEAANGPWELSAGDAFGNWTPVLRTNVTDGVFRYTDPAVASRASRFYRLAPPAP